MRPGRRTGGGCWSAGLYLKEVQDEVHRLVDRLGLDVGRHLLAVPGNHDIELEKGDSNYSQEEPYKKFLKSLLKAEDEFEDLEQGRRLEVGKPRTSVMAFVGFNSIKPRDAEYQDYGYVGKNRVDTMLGELEEIDQTRISVVFAVLHHHLVPVEPFVAPQVDRKASLTLDAGELVDAFEVAGVDVVLHGHQHRPFVARGDRSRREGGSLTGHDRPLWILGAGSAGSKELPPGVLNSFSVYTPTQEGLRVRIVEFGGRDAEGARQRGGAATGGAAPQASPQGPRARLRNHRRNRRVARNPGVACVHG